MVHATSGNNVSKASYSSFLAGNQFIKACKPKNCTLTIVNGTQFATMASTLLGVAYILVAQISYPLYNDGSTVTPLQITAIRCDGVVEYTYERYNYKVGGGTSNWNISLNYQANRNTHTGFAITPKKQYQSLLSTITTNENDLR